MGEHSLYSEVDEAISEVIHSTYLRPGLTPEDRSLAVDQIPWICETVVDGEDFWVAGRTEPGIRTGLLDKVVFGRNEPAPSISTRDFWPRWHPGGRAKEQTLDGIPLQ